MSKISQKILVSILILIGGAVFLLPKIGQAQEYNRVGRIFKLINLNLGTDFNLFEKDFAGGASVCIGDLDGDGRKEIVAGSGPGRRSEVRVYTHQGKKTQYVIYPFDPEFIGGIDVACGDLTGDKVDEIVVAVASKEQAHIKVYQADKNKTVLSDFFAEPSEFRGGVHIATGDVDRDGIDEIVVSRGMGTRSRIRIFEPNGTPLATIIYPFEKEYKSGADVAVGDVDGDGEDEIIVSTVRNAQAHIKTYETNGALKASFIAFLQSFAGGVNISTMDANLDGLSEIIAGAGPGGGPHVRVFNYQGVIQNSYSFYPFEKSYNQGVSIAGADLDGDRIAEIITVPTLNYDFKGPKKIVIDISEQKIKAYEGSNVVLDTLVSTGKPGMPTPLGTFKILSKNPRAWSSRYGLYMPYWMSFTYLGHGIHELPEWPGGYKEGASHLGIRVSHGCVRLGVGPAKQLYDWANIGTPVIVQE